MGKSVSCQVTGGVAALVILVTFSLGSNFLNFDVFGYSDFERGMDSTGLLPDSSNASIVAPNVSEIHFIGILCTWAAILPLVLLAAFPKSKVMKALQFMRPLGGLPWPMRALNSFNIIEMWALPLFLVGVGLHWAHWYIFSDSSVATACAFTAMMMMPWVLILGLSGFTPFDKTRVLVFHIVFGTLTTLMGLYHATYHWMDLQSAVFQNTRAVFGLVAGLSLLVVLLTSVTPMRRLHFSVFASAHQLTMVAAICLIIHCRVNFSQVAIALGLHFVQKVRSAWRLVTQRWVLVSATATPQVTELILEPAQPPSSKSGTLFWKIAREINGGRTPGSFLYPPGSYCYIRVPSVSKIEAHPISIASGPARHSTRFIIKDMGRGTWSNKVRQEVKARGRNVKILVDGPFGHQSMDLTDYSHVVLISGGVGVTPMLSTVTTLAQRWAGEVGRTLPFSLATELQPRFRGMGPIAKTIHTNTPIKHVSFIWAFRDPQLLRALNSELDALKALPGFEVWCSFTGGSASRLHRDLTSTIEEDSLAGRGAFSENGIRTPVPSTPRGKEGAAHYDAALAAARASFNTPITARTARSLNAKDPLLINATPNRPPRPVLDMEQIPQVVQDVQIGRPDLLARVSEAVSKAKAKGDDKIAVLVSGPDTLLRAASKIIPNSIDGVSIHIHTESFEF